MYMIKTVGEMFLEHINRQIVPREIVKKVIQNVIVENIDSGVRHFIIFVYVYDIKLLGKWFFNT
jgi:hypothetical protein